MREFQTEQEFIELLSHFNLGEKVIEDFRQLFRKGVSGDGDSLVKIAEFFHEAVIYQNAFAFYMLAAKMQQPEALYMLGNYAYEGLVEKENNRKAFTYYEQAAELGHADAMNNLADMYLNGEGIGQDDRLALYWFEKAAEQGVVEAMFTLGIMYEQGLGMPINYEQALSYYKEAASGGDLEAMYRVGTIYMTPLLHVEQDLSIALHYFKQAAQEEHLDSVFNLGYMYENGVGVEVDGEQALMYYEIAADYDDISAIQAIIRLYLEGKVIQRDDLMAQRWKRRLKFEG